MMRNFICPETEVPCERVECKKDVLCALRQEEARPAHYWGEFSKSAVDRLMRELATADLESAYRVKYGKVIGRELLREKRIEWLGLQHDDYAARAREILRWRAKRPSLEELGL
jgi:hypothetical protein